MNIDTLNTISSRIQSALDNNLYEQFKGILIKYNMLDPTEPPNDLDLMMIFSDYIHLFKTDGMKALIGYVQWSEKELTGPEANTYLTIRGTIAHDLGDRNEPCMLPRSSGYLEYYQDAATARAAIRKFPWVKRLHQAHLYTSGNGATDCGMPMLGNNYANHYPMEDWELCEKCHPSSIEQDDGGQEINARMPLPSGHSWKPLEQVAAWYKDDKVIQAFEWGPMYADDFMHMGTWPIQGDREIQLYKHINTRRYLNMDADGNFYTYDSHSGEYEKVQRQAAVKLVLDPQHPLDQLMEKCCSDD
jgi:hypothetical protein